MGSARFVKPLAWVGLIILIGPIVALAIRVPWLRFPEIVVRPETLEMVSITLSSAAWSTVITTLLGVPIALLLRGKKLVRIFVLLPLAMPPVVGGLALTALIGRRGITAPILDALGLQFAFAYPGVVASHIFVSLPFVVVAVDGALRTMDREIERSALGLGMSRSTVLNKITLPAIAAPLATGAGLAFARSLGEFGTTITFAGSMPGKTRTLPLGIYLEREIDPDAALAMAALLIGIALVVLVLATLPSLLQKSYKPTVRTIGDIDVERVRALSTPAETTHAGEFIVIIGPNGAGKTTYMRTLDGVLLTQNPGLPRTCTVKKALEMVTKDADAWISAAGLADLSDVPVPALSGGQAAHVALVRALATRPARLLLDEPLAAIDVARASAWRTVLHAVSKDRQTMLVTHNPTDIYALATSVIVIEGGKVAAQAPVEEILRVPPTQFVADLTGLNRITGTINSVHDGIVTLGDVSGVAGEDVPWDTLVPGAQAVAVFAPEAAILRLYSKEQNGSGPQESARNHWLGVVSGIAHSGGKINISVTIAGGNEVTVPITPASFADLALDYGTRVSVVAKALATSVYPR
ncbi:ABC transporter permease subunit [Corynebacterium glucuronolyticum]|uniref:ABC transporter permease subunit n=1 Tax=Corynebacterium glucuronolyticum TaxID=39791 RepID=A0A7T4JUM5_9CORY|nr:ATP-binding cassette domain-containing protein [Corynebacterium glucuronolyticum]QQB45989.1 ABC transporter permease subunit [Corynebacterium glucuronolyticum]WKD63284.1 Sulfate transport system permease protein CysW [Corynebacterium glucuronolyticum DSM 44120]SMB77399.1 molybdate transport system permease protein [Corynebacterium glucuronolyticum]